MALQAKQGEDIVKYARSVIEGYFGGTKPKRPDSLKAAFSEKVGVFATLHKGGDLRGCIGFPEPVINLGDAVEQAALSAALEDPRFPQVEADEMEDIVVEVSLLTKPELVQAADPREYPARVKVGRDGLIAQSGYSRGLLLPQVPVEQGWDSKTFLCHTCTKAGLPSDEWTKKGFKLYSFTAQIFSEDSPRGRISERPIS